MKTFIITCKKLQDRLPEAVKTATTLTNNYTPVRSWDAEELNQEAIDDYGKIAKLRWTAAVKEIAPILQSNVQASQNQNEGAFQSYIENVNKYRKDKIIEVPNWMKSRCLSAGEISVLMKHFWAIGNIANGWDEYGLILEDDVRVHDQSKKEFKMCLKEFIEQNGDYLDLAGGCNLHSGAEDTRLKYSSLLAIPRTRTNAAYIVRKDLAKTLMNKFLPLIFPIDWHLQYIMPKSANVFWANKPPLIHGSEQGLVSSWRQ